MGEYLPFVNFGSGVLVSILSCGGSHSLIITDQGKIKTWGANSEGAL